MEPSYLYVMLPVIEKPDRIKIGLTDNIDRRKSKIEAACGHQLVCIWGATFDNRYAASQKEKSIHKILGEHRLKGEWFDFNDETIGYFIHLENSGIGKVLEQFKKCLAPDFIKEIEAIPRPGLILSPLNFILSHPKYIAEIFSTLKTSGGIHV